MRANVAKNARDEVQTPPISIFNLVSGIRDQRRDVIVEVMEVREVFEVFAVFVVFAVFAVFEVFAARANCHKTRKQEPNTCNNALLRI